MSDLAAWVVAVAAILTTQIAVATLLLGIGLLAFEALSARARDGAALGSAFWVGFAIALLLCIGWNFFAPIGLATSAALAAPGAVGAWRARSVLSSLLAAAWRESRAWLAAAAICAVWIANQGIGANDSWDGATFHQQAVLWARGHAVVPGLANLYGPLGFNNASFLYAAALDVGPWSARSAHVANGVLLLAASWQAIAGASRWRSQPAAAFELVLLAPLLRLALTDARTFDAAVPATCLVIAAGLEARDVLAERGSDDARTIRRRLAALALMLASAVAAKSSSVVFAAALALAVGLAIWRGRTFAAAARLLAPAALCAVVFATAWGARGAVLTGYLGFPSTALPLPVEWRVPEEHAETELAFTGYTERDGSFEIGSRWIETVLWNPLDLVVPIALTAAFAWLALRRARRRPFYETDLAFFAVVAAPAFVVWFTAAPALRYVIGFAWLLAAAAGSDLSRALASAGEPRRGLRVALLSVALAPLLVLPVASALRAGRNPLREIARANVERPKADFPSLSIVPEPTAPFQTDSGLVLHVPAKQCRGAPLPCTINPAPNLRARDPADLGKGFVVDGPWRSCNFPTKWRRADFAAGLLERTGRSLPENPPGRCP